jgi:hypothetical protein
VLSPAAQTVSWDLEFEPADPYLYPVESPAGLQAVAEGVAGALVRWPAQYNVKAGYVVEVDGQPAGVAFSPHATLRDLVPGRSYRLGVRSVWYDGKVGEKAAEIPYTASVPDVAYLSELAPVHARHDWRNAWREVGRDRSIGGHPLSAAGKVYLKGLGTHSGSDVLYETAGAFNRFSAQVALDDEVKPPRPVEAVFEVWGDGKRLWKSEAVKSGQAPVPVDVDVTGVRLLTLKVLAGSDGPNSDHADWLEARLQ